MPESNAPRSRNPALPTGFQKRLGAGFGCPACGYKGWNALVATSLDHNRRVGAYFWCPSCSSEFVLQRRPWVWLGLRTLFIQVIGFAILYSVVMLMQGQIVPWIFMIGVSLAALCILLAFTMVLRSPTSYRQRQ